MGNRGLLHDAHGRIQRPYRLKAWLTCQLAFKGIYRKILSPGQYTELFFLDEVTAFAAGHRPCCECRREDFKRFKKFWLAGNPSYGFSESVAIGQIDEILHGERINSQGEKVRYQEDLSNLPEGCLIDLEGSPFLVTSKGLWQWTAFGYRTLSEPPKRHMVSVLTPKSIVQSLRAGYKAQMAIQP
jgi:hypothetical protein